MLWLPLDLLVQTAYRRVVPLYSFDHKDRPCLSASAIPFQIGDRGMLITATHCCFQDGNPTPLFVYGEKQLHALKEMRGAWEYIPGRTPDADIAVIALEQSCADDLRRRHSFCAPDDVSHVLPKTPGIHYLIIGYPVSRNRRRPPCFGLPSKATALITGDVAGVESVRGTDKTPECHFAIKFPYTRIFTPRGGVFHVPPPYGMSGGGIWRVEIDMIGRLAGRPYLVGVGIEYHKAQKTFVAARVQTAAPLVKDLFDLMQNGKGGQARMALP